MFEETFPQRIFTMRVTTITVRATDIIAASTTPPIMPAVIAGSEAAELVEAEVESVVVSLLLVGSMVDMVVSLLLAGSMVDAVLVVAGSVVVSDSV